MFVCGGGHAAVVWDAVCDSCGEATADRFVVWDEGSRLHDCFAKNRWQHVRDEAELVFALSDKITRCYICNGCPEARARLARRVRAALGDNVFFPIAIHPGARVSPDARIGEGCFVGALAVVDPHAVVGAFCILNTHSYVGHDCVLGDYANVNPRATLCGGVVVGERAVLGAASCIREKVRVGAGIVVGMGAIVVADAVGPAGAVWTGVPAKRRAT